jgi:hypothetical protein
MTPTLVALLAAILTQPALECARFTSNGRLNHGAAYEAALPRGFRLHLRPDGDLGWDISVEQPGSEIHDYMWVVSPPLRTAPQRKIGPGYGLQARDSAGFERDLRFVLSDADYREAVKAIDDPDAADTLKQLQRLGQGTLALRVEGFGIRKLQDRADISNEAFEWIQFRGEACVPRRR